MESENLIANIDCRASQQEYFQRPERLKEQQEKGYTVEDPYVLKMLSEKPMISANQFELLEALSNTGFLLENFFKESLSVYFRTWEKPEEFSIIRLIHRYIANFELDGVQDAIEAWQKLVNGIINILDSPEVKNREVLISGLGKIEMQWGTILRYTKALNIAIDEGIIGRVREAQSMAKQQPEKEAEIENRQVVNMDNSRKRIGEFNYHCPNGCSVDDFHDLIEYAEQHPGEKLPEQLKKKHVPNEKVFASIENRPDLCPNCRDNGVESTIKKKLNTYLSTNAVHLLFAAESGDENLVQWYVSLFQVWEELPKINEQYGGGLRKCRLKGDPIHDWISLEDLREPTTHIGNKFFSSGTNLVDGKIIKKPETVSIYREYKYAHGARSLFQCFFRTFPEIDRVDTENISGLGFKNPFRYLHESKDNREYNIDNIDKETFFWQARACEDSPDFHKEWNFLKAGSFISSERKKAVAPGGPNPEEIETFFRNTLEAGSDITRKTAFSDYSDRAGSTWTIALQNDYKEILSLMSRIAMGGEVGEEALTQARMKYCIPHNNQISTGKSTRESTIAPLKPKLNKWDESLYGHRWIRYRDSKDTEKYFIAKKSEIMLAMKKSTIASNRRPFKEKNSRINDSERRAFEREIIRGNYDDIIVAIRKNVDKIYDYAIVVSEKNNPEINFIEKLRIAQKKTYPQSLKKSRKKEPA
jgi:hypothetical protein